MQVLLKPLPDVHEAKALAGWMSLAFTPLIPLLNWHGHKLIVAE